MAEAHDFEFICPEFFISKNVIPKNLTPKKIIPNESSTEFINAVKSFKIRFIVRQLKLRPYNFSKVILLVYAVFFTLYEFNLNTFPKYK